MPFNSPPSIAGNARTIVKTFADAFGGMAVLSVWTVACRVASLVVRVASSAPDLYVYVLDGLAGDENYKVIARSSLCPSGAASVVTFEITSEVDAVEGGFPFDKGCVVVASPNPELASVDIFPDPYIECTARVQIAPRDCDPRITNAVRAALQPVEQQLQIVGRALTSQQAAQPLQQGSGYTSQQSDTNRQNRR
jgi:hypothetical protein